MRQKGRPKAILNNSSAKRVEELKANLMRVEGHVKCYEELAGCPHDEGISVTLLISTCVKVLRERLETANKAMPYKALQCNIVSYIGRYRMGGRAPWAAEVQQAHRSPKRTSDNNTDEC